MNKFSGKVNVHGTISYVPQQPWIQNETVKNNIIFGNHLDEALYNLCIKSCALETDLNLLPAGDKTEIGEKVGTIFRFYYLAGKQLGHFCFYLGRFSFYPFIYVAFESKS